MEALFLRKPPLNNSSPTRVEVAIQVSQLNAAKTASARAALQTLPRQKSSLERNTERAMNPAKWKMELKTSTLKWIYGWETWKFVRKNPRGLSVSFNYLPRAAYLGVISRYASESMEKRDKKIRKLIWEGDAVSVSASYQCATIYRS